MGELNKQSDKKIVVVVSGGFDPLHIGHIRMFQEAKKLGNYLIVLINNDNWLRAKKGYIFMPEHERKEIIEAVKNVDRAILTKHDPNPKDMSVCRELQELKPHIFANGGDRNKKNIPEVPLCNQINCKMVFNIGDGGKIQSSSWLLNNYKNSSHHNDQIHSYISKKIIIFDLDGTLTKSKANLDKQMSVLLCELLKNKKVAVIGGGSYQQFQKQFLNYFKCPSKYWKNLLILPTCGGAMYQYGINSWEMVYKNYLTSQDKIIISKTFKQACKDINYTAPKKLYGKVMEDRDSQITFSLLGQKAPLEEKIKWNKHFDIRPKLQQIMEKYLPNFNVRIGGKTSLDVTKRIVDKEYGVRQIAKLLSISIADMLFIGDDLREGGNDFAVIKTGIDTLEVSSHEDTKKIIQQIITQSASLKK